MYNDALTDVARAIHEADDGDDFTLIVHGPESEFMWQGRRREMMCALDLLAARVHLEEQRAILTDQLGRDRDDGRADG